MRPLGKAARNNGKVPEYREMFSQDQEIDWYVGEIPKLLHCPNHSTLHSQLTAPILSEGNLSTGAHDVLGFLSHLESVYCDYIFKGSFNHKFFFQILTDITTHLPKQG